MGERGGAKERVVAKRVLMVITPRIAGDLRSAALSAAAVAGEAAGRLRIVTIRPIPPARVDRYDRIIADENREMAQLAAAAEEQMAARHGAGRPRRAHQLRAWYLARALPVPVVLLPSGPDGVDERRPETIALPAFRRGRLNSAPRPSPESTASSPSRIR